MLGPGLAEDTGQVGVSLQACLGSLLQPKSPLLATAWKWSAIPTMFSKDEATDITRLSSSGYLGRRPMGSKVGSQTLPSASSPITSMWRPGTGRGHWCPGKCLTSSSQERRVGRPRSVALNNSCGVNTFSVALGKLTNVTWLEAELGRGVNCHIWWATGGASAPQVPQGWATSTTGVDHGSCRTGPRKLQIFTVGPAGLAHEYYRDWSQVLQG